MRLIELRLKNLNSLKGEWHIDFSDAAFLSEGLFAITGQTGAGKTTILDAICLALYGQTPRLGDITGSTNEIMTQGTGECGAEVIIEIGSKRYQCSWYQHRAYKKAKGNLLPIKHEISDVETKKILEEKKSKTTAYIQDLIGMDFNQFTRSIMLAQGSFAAFLKSDVANRAAILEKITGTAIYAKISLNVHEKKRFEEEELGKLKAGINSLSLLSQEDEKQLAEDMQALNHEQAGKRQTLNTLTEQLKWLDDVEYLQQNLSAYQAEFNIAQLAQISFNPEAKRLETANKALEIDSHFSKLTYDRDMNTRLKREQQDLLKTLPRQEEELEQAATSLSSTSALEKQAADELHDTLPVIAKARELDANIKQQSHSLKDDQQRNASLSADTKRLSQDIERHKETEKQTKTQLARVEQYLNDHLELTELDTDMAIFDGNGSRLKTLLQDNAKVASEKLTYQDTTSQLQADFDKLYAQLSADKLRITQQRDQLTSLQQQQAHLIQDQALVSMRSEQEQIDEIGVQIEQASFKQQQLFELAAQSKKITLALPLMTQELVTLENSIKDSESAVKDAKLKRQDKQEHLHLLQKVAKLEDYIAELTDGVPCPLCGAKEHPYSDHHPLLDNSTQNESSPTQQTMQQISDLDALINGLEQTLSKHRIESATKQTMLDNQQNQLAPLQQQSKTLCSDIQAYISSLLASQNQYSDSVTAIIQSLTQIDDSISILGQQLDSEAALDLPNHALSILSSTKQKIAEQKAALKDRLVQYDNVTQRISKLGTAIENDEREQQAISDNISNLATDMKLNSQKVASLDNKIADNFSELKAIITTILSLVSKYPAGKYDTHLNEVPDSYTHTQESLKALADSFRAKNVLNTADCDQHIDRLRQQRNALTQLKQQFSAQKNTKQNLMATLGSLAAQIETKQSQLDNDNIELKKLEQRLADNTKAIEQLKQNRKEIFADKNLDDEESKLRAALEVAKSRQTAAQRQLDSAEQTRAQLQDRQQHLATELQLATAMLSTQENSFATLLTESHFADEATFVRARLPKEEREALHLRKLTIDNALQQAQSQLSRTQQLLEQKLAAPLIIESISNLASGSVSELTADGREVLASQHQKLQTDIDQLSKQIGAIDQKLQDNENQKGVQADQLDAINAQKEKLQVWQQLHILIGSADGKKYRTFAQGLTFEVMITHANTQLQKMSDRYLLIHDEDSPLELNVIDNYQGGDIRSTKNLSGGEGFIISLALALGLSQMASHNIRVDSLFLDEGFGTLDEESLDIALDTLTSLQQEGKLIGIISHVQALKERITTQIKVEKLSGGFSQITGQGCHKIAS